MHPHHHAAVSVPVPDRMSHLDVYKGYPVPDTVLVGSNGVPDFKVTDHGRWLRNLAGGFCGICGDRLARLHYFVGGELCLKHHHFFDLGMHLECALYSLQVCPFLCMVKGYSLAANLREKHSDYRVTVMEHIPVEPPKEFHLFEADGFRLVKIRTGPQEESPAIHASVVGPSQCPRKDWN